MSYWRLGESSGTVACDSKGSNPGSFVGGVTLGLPGGLAGDPATSVLLDGNTGYVNVPQAASLDVGDRFSIEAWVKRGSVGGTYNQVIASKQANAWVLMLNTSNQLVLRQSTVDDIAHSSVKVADTTSWHHVVATKDGSSVHLYLDGADVTGTVSNLTLASNTQPLVIGQSSGGANYQGNVQEVALYNTAIAASAVTNHYQVGTGTTPPPPPPPSNDPVIATAGNIACDSSDPNFNGGVGNAAGCQQSATAGLMARGKLAGSPIAAVLPLGDEQYEYGDYSLFTTVYDSTWGAVRTLTRPAPGNHEYGTANAQGYFDYFDGVGQASGPAGQRSTGYYSYDVGAWHIIALNSNCGAITGGCAYNSPQEQWLRTDLASHTQKCTLAYWHHATFTSGYNTEGVAMTQMWKDLYNYNADVVLGAHNHQYERFAPQTPTGQPDSARGIREFVVGTGGKSLEAPGPPIANSQVREWDTYGVLKLTLHPTSYDWQFVPAAGGSFTDQGTGTCH